MRCKECGSRNPKTVTSCARCGGPLRPRLPKVQPELTESSSAERRRVTVVFCDLVGSTELSGQLDPEELDEVVRKYRNAAADVIRRQEGHVLQFLGDGVLACFGYPIGHEDDARRAVRAALEVVEAVMQLDSRMSQSLQVRIAVHTGLAIVGKLSDESGITIIGETPNVAARLQSLAEPGTVIVSDSTYRLVEGFFVSSHLGPHRLKGIQRSIDLYSVLSESRVQSHFERAIAKGLTPFVSREAELHLLLDKWSEARDGPSQIVFLTGEAGIGKSRLLRMLRERTAGEIVIDLAVRCSQYYQDSALYPWIDLLQRLFGFESAEPVEAKLDKLERALDSFGFSLELPLFAELLSLPNDRYPVLSMSPQRRKQKTFDAILAWLFKLAERNPTRLIVEDVHWADPSSLGLLGLLVDKVAQTRMFVALAFRSGFILPWRIKPHVTNIALAPLSREATDLMVSEVAGGELPPSLAQEIVEKTEGVPLFVEELTRMVLESGILDKKDTGYELTSSSPFLAIPSTLYESLMARLDRLGTAKEVAQIAAVIGKECSYDLLRAVSQFEETKLTGALIRLVDAELFDQRPTSSANNYRFRHALIRDAAYESLLKKKRRQYHRKTAEILQERFPETVEAQPELLANHFSEAGLIAEAVPFWIKAGQRAIERSADQEALRHLSRGLELLNLLPESLERFRDELLLQTCLGTALIATKGFSSPDVERAYSRARQLCQQAGEVPQLFPVLSGLWMFYTSRGEHVAARDLAEHCLRIAQTVEDTGLLVHSHQILGVGLIITGDFVKANENLQQALEKYDARKHRSMVYTYGQDPAAFVLTLISWPLWFLGYPDQALRRCREAETLAHQLNHPFTSLTVAAFGTWLYQFTRNPEAVEALASQAISISTDHGFAFYRPYGLIMRGWALTERGQVSDGIAQMRTGLDEYRTTGGGSIKPSFLSPLAEAYGKMGQFKQALNVLAEAKDLADENEERWWQAELHRIKGELLLQHRGGHTAMHNDEVEAEDCFHQALGVARSQRAKSLELRAAMSLCRLWIPQSRCSEAQRLLQKSLDTFEEGFETRDLTDAKLLMEVIGRS
jgi:predicted ATPase/class 3 adenylate cyclase